MVDRLRESVNELSRQVRGLRAELHQRPTREEVGRQKRFALTRMVVFVLVVVLTAAFVQDQHLEGCGAGARAEDIIQALIAQEVSSQEEFAELANKHQPNHCDITYPLHTHDLEDWPTQGNIVGFVMYGVLLIAALTLVWPRRWEREVLYGRRAGDVPAEEADGAPLPHEQEGAVE